MRVIEALRYIQTEWIIFCDLDQKDHTKKYEDTSTHKPDCEIMRIDFDDLEEVMTLIHCLDQFAHEVRNRMGEWRRER